MATDYAINGTLTQIGPFSQRWRQAGIGRDHTKRPIYSGNEEIDLLFDSTCITFAREWLEAASAGGSINLTVLNRYSLGFTDLSNVFLEVIEYPAIEATIARPFSLVVRSASAP